ncbi:MAG: hypothetical protein ACYCV7_09460 [Acidimicrobiales bacterium]
MSAVDLSSGPPIADGPDAAGSQADAVVERAGKRRARQVAQMRGLRTRAASGNLDRWLLLAGGVSIPLGIMLIILGWAGAAGTPLLFEQVPYLISGGLLGLGLVFCGGFVYFAYWLTVLVREGREERRDLVGALSRIEILLAAGSSAALPNNTEKNGDARSPRTGQLVATAAGTMIHRPDCPVVSGGDHLREVSAEMSDFAPCAICNPLSAEP